MKRWRSYRAKRALNAAIKAKNWLVLGMLYGGKGTWR